MTKKAYAWTNLLMIVFLIFWNYYANTGQVFGRTVGEISARYANLFTPAGYAFSIWGIIFIALLGHGIFQVRRAYHPSPDSDFILRMGPWLLVANLGNVLWLSAWLLEYTGLSVQIMLGILLSLTLLVVRLDIATKRRESAQEWAVVVPISLYAGWIAVATIANVSAYLAKLEWAFLFSEMTWAALMVVVATALNGILLWQRRMRVYAGVGIWALLAVAVRHWGALPILAGLAAGGAAFLLLGIAIQLGMRQTRLAN